MNFDYENKYGNSYFHIKKWKYGSLTLMLNHTDFFTFF